MGRDVVLPLAQQRLAIDLDYGVKTNSSNSKEPSKPSRDWRRKED